MSGAETGGDAAESGDSVFSGLEEGPWAYTVEFKVMSTKYRRGEIRDFLGVPLPDDVQILWEEKDEPPFVWLEEGQEEINGNSISFVCGGVVDASEEELESGRNSDPEIKGQYRYKVREFDDRSPKFRVRLPVEWREHRESNPFYGAESDQDVVVELDPSTKEFRWYRPDDYRFRSSKVLPIQRTPLLLPILADREVPTVSVEPTNDRVSVEEVVVKVFDGRDPNFVETARRHDSYQIDSEGTFYYELTEDVFRTVAIHQDISEAEADILQILWDPDGQGYDVKQFPRTLYQGRGVVEAHLELPVEGTYAIRPAVHEEGEWSIARQGILHADTSWRSWLKQTLFGGHPWKTDLYTFGQRERGKMIFYVPNYGEFEVDKQTYGVDNGMAVWGRWPAVSGPRGRASDNPDPLVR